MTIIFVTHALGASVQISGFASSALPRSGVVRAFALKAVAASLIIAALVIIPRAALAQFAQQGDKLVYSTSSSPSSQGFSVSLSADGNTALVGAPSQTGGGAAFVYTRSAGVWSEQAALVASNKIGTPQFGSSVSLSADGNTAIVGGAADNSNAGAAWIFSRTGSSWGTGTKLIASDPVGSARQGSAVAMSADGQYALVGGSSDDGGKGAGWIWFLDNGAWTQQTKLPAATGMSGNSGIGGAAAISGDGDTVILGGRGDNSNIGAAWLYVRDGAVWSQQGDKLVGSGGVGALAAGGQGVSVALSNDGNTALVGGYQYDNARGAAWFFTRSGAVWAEQTRIVPSFGNGWFGNAVALSSDGNTAMIGARLQNSSAGGAYIYVRVAGGWSLQGGSLFGTNSLVAQQGTGVALSADAGTALSGGSTDNPKGAAWVFVQTPTVTAITPDTGASSGGTSVTITGTGFTGADLIADSVQIGGSSASSVVVVDPNHITAVTGSSTAGTVDVNVTNAIGTGTGAGLFTYAPAPTVTGLSPAQGGSVGATSVVITGTDFTADSVVKFGADTASRAVDSATQITATSPAGTGVVDVTVTTVGGTSATSADSKFTYLNPAITNVSPAKGPIAGGNTIVLTGTRLGSATGVTMGGCDATASISNNTSTSVSFTSTGCNPYTPDITVTTAEGSATISNAYTYVKFPHVTGVSPSAGGAGTFVTITGSFLDESPTVKFGATVASSVIVNAVDEIKATAPAHAAGAVNVTVTTPGGTSTETNSFTYIPAPVVTTVAPGFGPLAGGTTVTITGTNLANATAVKFGTTSGAVTANSATSITVTSPSHAAGTVDATVVTAGGTSATSAADRFNYADPPTVTQVLPSAGTTAGGTTVTITGTHFTGVTGVTGVTFSGVAGTNLHFDSDTQVTVKTPAHVQGGAGVRVTTNHGATNNTTDGIYTFLDPATITSVTPSAGPLNGGTAITIKGTNYDSAFEVKIGGTSSLYNMVNSTTITATTPQRIGPAGAVSVEVMTAAGTVTNANAFSYFAKPAITAINPNQGPANGGTLVSIVGTNLTGATGVKFGPTASSSFSVQNATHATATAPAHIAGAVNVTLTTPGGTSAATNGNKFTYTKTPVMTTIAKFVGGKNDGSKPAGGLVSDVAGVLYGTTSQGGANGLGTVFKLTPSGPNYVKTILHQFTGIDGATPFAGLVIDSAKNLYGVTTAGGNKNKGVLFKLTGTTYKVLYNFQGTAADGGVPYATLARDATGLLYGATTVGGSKNMGTAFTFKEPTTFKVTHHFLGGADGANAQGAMLLDAQKNVYGTTIAGGTPNQGTAYKVAPNGALTILHTFAAANTDGHQPRGGLFMKGTTIYGTASIGGAQNKGVVFKVVPPSVSDLPLLFSFTGVTGANPYAGVIGDTAGVLYGTTFNGGATNHGVVFNLLPPVNGQTAWSQSVMYAFKGGATEGASPAAPVLLGKNRTLFGTTNGGGSAACAGGCGTVFKVTY